MEITPSVFRRILLLAAAVVGHQAAAATYHVDAGAGDDTRSGASPDQAWKSLEKVNATVLQPGDQVLFKAGQTWTGQLKPRGPGKLPDAQVALTRIGRYGEGPAPRIDGNGVPLDTVLVENIECLEVADLEVTNQGATTMPWRTGVKVSAREFGPMRRIYLRRLFVHDVNGDLRKSQEGCGIYFEAKGRGGPLFDGLLVEDCHVVRTDRNGICQRGTGRTRSRNVIIRNNLLEDIGGDGIKLWGTDGGLIERNVVRGARARCTSGEAAAGIWPFACDDTVVQFNEVSDTKGTTDGEGYDSDYYCRRTLIQYNYSFHNEGGFLLVCSPGSAYNEGTVVRYNLSVEDGTPQGRVFHFGGGASDTHVYNNTIILGARQQLPLMVFGEWDKGLPRNTRFTNNLFLVAEGGRARYQFGPSQGHVFENNLFVGKHEGLPPGTIITATEPPFSGPLEPKPGLKSLAAFKPRSGADWPRGRLIDKSGGRDFFGTPVPKDRGPTLGCAEAGR